MNFETYYHITYAAWLGKLIGIQLGAPVEGWTYQEIKNTYGHIHHYLVPYGTFASDDDANGPFFFVRSLLQHPSVDITPNQMAEALLGYVSDGHGFFWWGGKGISSEDTSYHNLKNGISAPQSGSMETNGKTIAEQIGGQIFSDCWGYVAAGKADVAARLASKMASVTHDGDGIEGAKFIAACIALAYEYSDVRKVMDDALGYLDPQSDYVACVKDVLAHHDAGQTFEEVRDYILEQYSYAHYPGVCHIIPNTAIMVLAMAYGENDFTKTLCSLCECGWDTDCTCGNVGSIMGALVGIKGIDDTWIVPLKDVLLSSSCMGSANIDTISNSALLYALIGAKLHGIHVDEKYLHPRDDFYFHLPYSTQGFETDNSHYGQLSLRTKQDKLNVIINQGYPQHTARLYRKTYYQLKDMYDCRYEPSFSPILYAGMTISFDLVDKHHLPITYRIYTKNIKGEVTYGEPFVLTDIPTTYSYTLNGDDSELYCECGIEMLFEKRLMHETISLLGFHMDHHGRQCLDFTKLPREDFGLNFAEESFTEIQGCTSIYNRAYTDQEGLHLQGDTIYFFDHDSVVKSIDVKAKELYQGYIDVLFDVQSHVWKRYLRISTKSIELYEQKGELGEQLLDCCKLNQENSINSLKIMFNNGLIKVKINDYSTITLRLLNRTCGCVGLHGSNNMMYSIFGCKLEAI